MKSLFSTLLTLILAATSGLAYDITSESIMSHIEVLAHDSLEGRQVGEIGEQKAAAYITSQFEQIGLVGWGDNGTFSQAFDFVKAIDLGERNLLVLNGVELTLESEYLPMMQSGSMPFSFDSVVWVDYGITISGDDGSYDDYEGLDVAGKAVVIKRFAPSSEDNPHVDFSAYESLTSKMSTALDHDAAGIFFVTPEEHDDTLLGSPSTNVTPKDIPVVFLRRAALEKLGLTLERPAITSLVGETELIKTRDTAYNVVGLLEAANDSVVIIGAHYDHLGWGAHNSLYVGTEPMIHNGADDNASGVAAMLELANYYAAIRDRLTHSILFAAFTGEEAGLLGSSHIGNMITGDSIPVHIMVNMDMIGRLSEQEDGLAIFGVGTCIEFKNYFDSLTVDGLKIATRESGTGPSDHTIFYNRKIPSLHLFTGAHNDYHKPSDDAHLIDSDGIVRVAQLVSNIVDQFDSHAGALTFQKTKDPDAGKRRARYSVTLGVMPDYVAEVKGLKIDGVTPDRPGERAGLTEGDIIIKMGAIDIGDIYDYMNALGKFRKGDTTAVMIERNGQVETLTVIFE